jgi:peptide/nickel transport system substrate-binding protein
MDHQVTAANLMHWETGGYDRLTAIHDGEVVPYLAKSWDVAPDNKSVTFTLRQDAKCHDGTPVTPKVVADSFDRLFTVAKKGINMMQTFGAGPWSVSADEDDWTVTINTETPFRALVQGVASGESGIVCPAGLADPEAMQAGFFGSGPYLLESAEHGDEVVLKKNPNWTWGPIVDGEQVTAEDLPEKQTWKIMPDQTAIANSLQTGAVNVARVAGPDVKRFAGSDQFSMERVRLNFPSILSFQQTTGHPTSDPALRKALSLAVDPASYAKAYLTDGSDVELATSFINPSHDCYDPAVEDLYPSGGIEEAKRVLEEAGYATVGSKLRGPDGRPVRLRVVTINTVHGEVGNYLIEAFKALGVEVELSNLDAVSALQLIYTGQQDVGISVGTSTVDDPASSAIGDYAGTPISDGGINMYGPPPSLDPTWSKLIEEALASSDCGPWQEAQQHALAENIMLPVALSYWTRVTAPSVEVANGFYFFEPWTIRNAS